MKRTLGRVVIAVALMLWVGLWTLLFELWRFSRPVRRDVEALFAQAASPREGAVVLFVAQDRRVERT